MNRFFVATRFVHAWAGAVLALLLMLVSATGIFLLWKDQYLKLTVPEARVAFTPEPVALTRIARGIEAAVEPGAVLSIEFATTELPLTYVILADEEYAYFDSEGGLVDRWQGNGRFEEWVYDLHHRLLLGDSGLLIVGIGAMLAVLLLILGLLSYWPFRRGWRIGLWPRAISRDALRASHRNLGLVLAMPLLLVVVTGFVLAFPSQTEELLLEERRLTQEYSDAMIVGLDDISGGDSGDWLPAMQRALDVFPDATIRSVLPPGYFNYYRVLGLQQPGEFNRKGMSKVYIDPEGGYMDVRIDALSLPWIERAYNAVYPLHTGDMGSLVYRMLLTLLGLGLFLLSAAGLYSFTRRFVRMTSVA